MIEIRKTKQLYSAPRLELIKLDNEISLQLQSSPPIPDNESLLLKHSDYFNNDPFKLA